MSRANHPYCRRKAHRRGPYETDAPMSLSPSSTKPATPDIAVTDHALLRYLERFEGVDVAAAGERLRGRLSSRRGVSEAIKFAGAAPHRIRVEGATFCLRNGRVVTCYP